MIFGRFLAVILVLVGLAFPVERALALFPQAAECEILCCQAPGSPDEDAAGAPTACPCVSPCVSCFLTALALPFTESPEGGKVIPEDSRYETTAEFASGRFSRPDVPPPRAALVIS